MSRCVVTECVVDRKNCSKLVDVACVRGLVEEGTDDNALVILVVEELDCKITPVVLLKVPANRVNGRPLEVKWWCYDR